jgi:hypothetical protein
MSGLQNLPRKFYGAIGGGVLALLALIAARSASCQVMATFHPQFSEKRTTSWDMCASSEVARHRQDVPCSPICAPPPR